MPPKLIQDFADVDTWSKTFDTEAEMAAIVAEQFLTNPSLLTEMVTIILQMADTYDPATGTGINSYDSGKFMA